jgi:hypothetical protein
MSNIINLDEYRSKKEGQKLRDEAQELLALLESFMLDDDPLIISVSDSDGTTRSYNLDELYSLSDSNPYD